MRRVIVLPPLLLACWCLVTSLVLAESQIVLVASELTEQAPHGHGNVYAPEIEREGDHWRMWYGGQGRDGHDRIHYADSTDGVRWTKRGIAVDCGDANHVNDPSVVHVDDTWWMFYTLALHGEADEIAAATSLDGIAWKTRGVVIACGPASTWDAGKVGRPSVAYADGRFRLWYDGQPAAATDIDRSITQEVRRAGRAVGYAESTDGLTWTRHSQPLLIGAGAVDVAPCHDGWRMVLESHEGTYWATSRDGYEWLKRGLLAKAIGSLEASGHVTPFLQVDADGQHGMLYYGAAERPSWNFNRIARQPVKFSQ